MIIRIKKIENMYLYMFAFFILMKMWRAFSGSSEAGGIWNYIQIFYAVVGSMIFMKYLPTLYRQKTVFFLAVYSVWTLLISLITVSSFSVSSFFNLIKILAPGMVLCIYYLVGLKIDDINNYRKLINITFYLAAVILIIPLARYMLAGGRRASGAGAVADVYYLLALLPIVLMLTEKKKWIIPLATSAVCILLSQKRMGLIAFVGVLIIVYLVDAIQTNNIRVAIRNIMSICAIAIVGYFLIKYMDQKFRLNIIERLMQLDDDGGSGRDRRWAIVIEALKQTNPINLFVGHGYRSTSRLLGGFAHNDFIQVIYEYGLFALIIYIAYFVSAIKNGILMFREKYSYSSHYIASIFVALCIAMFSFYVVDATYIIAACFAQGVLISDWIKWRQNGRCITDDFNA